MLKCSEIIALGPRPLGVLDRGGDEEEIGDVDNEEEVVGEARDITIADTETATWHATGMETPNELCALAAND